MPKRNLWLVKILIIICCARGGWCQLPTVKLNAYLIQGQYNLDQISALTALDQVRFLLLRDSIAQLKLVRFRSRKDICPNLNHLSQKYEQFYCWKAWLLHKGRLSTKRVTYLMVPPKQEGNMRYLEGLSDVCFKRGKFVALSTGELYNQDGAWRFPHSIIAAAHELGHMLGANHDNDLPISVMNGNVLPYVSDADLHYSIRSRQEIANCIG